MAGIGESAAETSPLSLELLFKVLTSATSGNPQQIKTSTKQLQAWEKTSGFYSCLQDVFLSNTAPLELRLLSLIQLKNGIDIYWRRSATNAVPTEEREKIRSRIIQSGLQEQNDRLVALNAICAGKIARFDFPTQWPNLFKDIISVIRSSLSSGGSALHLSNTLVLTHYVIKELSTVRLQRSRASLFTITPELFAVLREVYLFTIRGWQERLTTNSQADDAQTVALMVMSVQVLKILRRLIIAGYDYPHRETDVQEYWMMTQSHLQVYLELIHRDGLSATYKEAAGSHITQLAKFHCQVAEVHPVSFALLPHTTSLARNYWSAACTMRERQLEASRQGSEVSSVYESTSLRALLLLRACFKIVYNPTQNFKYKNAEAKEDPPRAKKIIQEELLTDDFALGLMRVLVNLFFLHTTGDMEEWLAEPEEWEMKEEGDEDAYERYVRPCAERLFLDIVLNFQNTAIDPLLDAWEQISNPTNDNVFAKEAVYCAIGLAGPVLHCHFDFNLSLKSIIVPELQNQQPNHNILRRRIAIMIAQWVKIDIAEDNRTLIYQIFQHLMDTNVGLNDQAVRITAGKRFKEVADEWHFTPAPFAPYAARIMSQLVSLIEEVNMIENKMALLHTLSIVVERLESEILPFADQIVTLLPPLWESSGKEHLMKQAIVDVLRKLVSAMGVNSSPIHGMVLPIIQGALEPGSETQVYILEDALDLWSAILKVAQSPLSPQLLSLFPLAFEVFEMENESPLKALRIAESYLLAAPAEMLQDAVRDRLIGTFTTLMAMKNFTIIALTRMNVELMIRAAGALGDEAAVQMLANSMMSSGLLPKILDSIHDHWEYNQATGPKRKDKDIPQDWRNKTDYFVILARIILGSTSAFVSVIQAWASSRGEVFETSMAMLLDELFNHMDNLGDPSRGKLLCLATTKLLETGQPWILQRLQLLITTWTSVVTELRVDEEDGEIGDSLVYKPLTERSDTPEAERRRGVTFTDPVHTIDITQYVKYYLGETIARAGGEGQFQEQWLVNVDKDVVKAFSALGIM